MLILIKKTWLYFQLQNEHQGKRHLFPPKHYENTPIQIYRKFHLQKLKFSNKKLWYFHISAKNTDRGYSLEAPRRGGSNEYPQAMFLSRNKKNNVYPCKPRFYYIKVGFKGVKIAKACLCDVHYCGNFFFDFFTFLIV